MLFLFGAVVFAIDVTDVMSAVAVGVALKKRGAFTRSCALYKSHCNFIHRTHILTIDACSLNSKSRSAAENRSGSRFLEVSVLVVLIVLANVNHGQLPQLRQIHNLVERSLSERAFAEEANRDTISPESLGCKSRTGSDAHASANNCVRAQVTRGGIGNVHR